MTEFTDVSGTFGPSAAATGWLAWRRRRQALSAWYHHHRTRLARGEKIALLR
ncbi:MAG TPA: hypothetical protein VJ351_01070 [Streptosporangiaceae bacterium]|jgi:hypothetical protein|nr:hypothetical protein [Streptosporangiaceae bacterium]